MNEINKNTNVVDGRPGAARSGLVRRGPRPLALEQRFMFDGAAVAEAADMLSSPPGGDAGPVAAEAIAPAPVLEPSAGAGLFEVVGNGTPAGAVLEAAVTEAQALIAGFAASNGAGDTLASLFDGDRDSAGAHWQQAAEVYLAALGRGEITLRVELRSHLEMRGAFGAFAARGPSGEPTIFLNAAWVADGASAAQLTRVLVEEFGHSVDAALNGAADTAGDEGEAFAATVLGIDLSDGERQRIAAEDDRGSVEIDGQTYEVEEASITFTQVFAISPTSRSEEANGFTTGASAVAGTHFRFTSADPSAPYFQGNNVAGTLSYVDGNGVTQNIAGVVSRLVKTGSTVNGLYFYVPGADGLIGGADDSAYVLRVNESFNFEGSRFYGTSSDPVDTAMNKFLLPNAAPVAVNDSATVLEGGSAAGNVLANDSDPNGDSLSVTGFSIGGVAGVLGQATAIAGVGTFTLQANGNFSFTPLSNYAGAVPAVTYTVSDGSAGATATLALAITPVNDAPAGADATIAMREGQSHTFSAADFGFSDADDIPANSFATVRIISLPAAGTLYFDGAAITQGQIDAGYEVAVADLTRLSYSASAAGAASFDFAVRDSGGVANGGADLDPVANTIAFVVTAGNTAPVVIGTVNADAQEAGGVANADAGSNPAGQLITGHIDDADGDTLKLASVASAVESAEVAATGTTRVAGRYGTLIVDADGSYTYELANDAAATQALLADSATETFTYTVADPSGRSVSNTLTITIHGRNDAPSAADDYNSVKEQGPTPAIYPGSGPASGNVLDNDTDVDGGDTLTVVELFATATAAATQVSATGNQITVASLGTPGNTTGVDVNDVVQVISAGTTLYDKSLAIQVTAVNTTTGVITLSSNVTIPAGSTIQFWQANNGGQVQGSNYYTTTGGTAATPTASTSVSVSGISGDIVAGMRVSGSGIPDGTTVVSVSGGNLTLSTAVTLSASTALAFSKAIDAGGTTIAGQRGTLQLYADGSYTYTLTRHDLLAGETYDERFTYRMSDAAGETGSAALTIRIEGTTNDTEPDALADTLIAVEAGGMGNSGGIDPSGNLITGSGSSGAQTDVGSTLVLTRAWSASGAPPAVTNVDAGTTAANPVTVTGLYGTLKIAADGSYSYELDNDNPTVEALTGATDTLTETFFYRVENAQGSDVARVTISIQGANDTPVARDDSALAAETGGVAEGVAGRDPAGNVLANDSDVDAGDVLAVTGIVAGSGAPATVVGAGSSSAAGYTEIAGLYGTLRIGADGSYVYLVDNANAAVAALMAGDSLDDVFTYEVRDGDGSGEAATAKLTVSVHGADDTNPPVNSLPAASGVLAYETLALPLAVADADGDVVGARVTVGNGTLQIGELHGATISAGANGSTGITLSGTQAQINAALATLSYRPGDTHSATDTLLLVSTDSLGNRDTDSLTISVTADGRDLAVSSQTINEASDYAVFTVSGQAGQRIRLELGDTGSGSGHAGAGADYLGALEYYDGSNWQAYLGGVVTIPGSSGASALLVRVAVLDDGVNEGAETFSLRATNGAGETATGITTLVDDGSGVRHTGAVSGGLPVIAVSALDDDRPLTVSNIEVNEKSPYAVFEVGGAVGQVVDLALVAGTATTADYGSSLQYLGGGSWQNYTGPVTLAGTTLLVRTTLVDDADYEGRETFGLRAANTGGGAVTGVAGIHDDGSGAVYLAGNTTATPSQPTDAAYPQLDDDRSLAVSSPLVNEASDYVVFTVSGDPGESVTLALLDQSVGGTVSGKAHIDAGQTLQVWDGQAWVDYSAAALPAFDAAGRLHVRVDIQTEQDGDYEGGETFALQVQLAGGTSRSGTATIVDDGTGVIYTGNVDGTGPETSTTALDDDRGGLSAPTGSDKTIAIDEDGSHTFSAGDFGFADADGHDFVAVRIDSLPLAGTLELDGVAVTAGQEIDIADLAKLVFAPAPDTSGEAYADLTFSVRDGSGYFAAAPSTLLFDVSPQPDAATVGGDDAASLTEDSASPDLTTGGTLTIGDPDSGEAAFLTTGVTASAGALGRFAIDASGRWTYSIPNSAVQYLTSGAQRVETFTVSTIDGTRHDVVITVLGVDDPATIGPDTDADSDGTPDAQQGRVQEDGTLTAGGRLTVGDADADQAVFVPQAGTAGQYGSFTLDAAGNWSYVLDNGAAQVQALKTGETVIERFTVTTADGTTTTVVITVLGLDDPATIGPVTDADSDGTPDAQQGRVQEDGTLTAGGRLTVGDADAGEAVFVPQSGTAGAYGRFTLDAAGNWSYVLDNGAAQVQALKTGETVTEQFTVTTADGTTTTVVITVLGVDDPAVIGPDSDADSDGTPDAQQGRVQEDGTLTAGGQLTVGDADAGEAVFVPQTATAGQYGRFTLDAAGNWTYVLDNGAAQVQALKTGETVTEQFTVTTADGTTTTVVVTIVGADEAPSVGEPEMPPPRQDPVAEPGVPPAPPPTPGSAAGDGGMPPFEGGYGRSSDFGGSGASFAAPGNDPMQPWSLSLLWARPGGDSFHADGALYTDRAGFPVVVIDVPGSNFAVYRGITDQYGEVGSSSGFSVPYDAFVHSDPNERVLLSATLASGQRLPDWVRFDPQSGEFRFQVPADFRGELVIKVVARDSQGREVSTLFRFAVGSVRDAGGGRAGLSEQLRMAASRPAAALAGHGRTPGVAVL